MHKLLIGITIGALLLARAQKGDRADLQLQYGKASQSPNRAVAAQAVLRMGQCYESLGGSEACKAYGHV